MRSVESLENVLKITQMTALTIMWTCIGLQVNITVIACSAVKVQNWAFIFIYFKISNLPPAKCPDHYVILNTKQGDLKFIWYVAMTLYQLIILQS